MDRSLAPAPSAADAAFTADPLDRMDEARADPARIAALRQQDGARVLVLHRGKALVRDEGAAARAVAVSPDALTGASLGEEVFLGRDATGPVFAVQLESDGEGEPPPGFEALGHFEDLRPLLMRLSADEASLLGTARAVLGWHARHRFCANCGAATELAHGGWRRECPACGAHHFPRTDPVAIMLITRGDQILLGANANFPPNFFSCLAGFIEPGETVEGATRREAFEEAGVAIGAVSYVASQPWPFPSSLMLGVRADALSDEAQADGVEITEVRWFTRNEIHLLLAGEHPDVRTPPPFAIAHTLIRLWAEGAV